MWVEEEVRVKTGFLDTRTPLPRTFIASSVAE